MLDSERFISAGDAERRLSEREDLSVWARAHYFERRPLTLTIMNVSESGFQIELSEYLEIGSTIFVQLHGLQLLAAKIVWIDGNIAGCEFHIPLTAKELEQIANSEWVAQNG